ncbi:hypothetical protein [Actinomadura macrotermitis]|uniref:WD40 repeat domain-containing protein n=1 Tax=Actinomadura macrotermitis TaxID=2585200 RepID=A0A7K0BYB9_9ACTN|nr:hypothetical protein [Actinomadura macrotermitis]MQY05624.1 hypothetical protein [Actinomadura macrotermitis]
MTTDLERRLRSAFEARTSGVRPPAEPVWDAPPTRRAPRLLLPVAAAALIAVLALFLAQLRGGTEPQEPSLALGGVAPVKPAASPTLVFKYDGKPRTKVVEVATNRITGTVEPPPGYTMAGPGAVAVDNRTYFFTVSGRGRRFVARVQVDDRGRPGPAELVARAPRTRDVAAAVPRPAVRPTGRPSAWAEIDAIVPSPDATRLALLLSGADGDAVMVWELRTGTGRMWGGGPEIGALAWTSDGRRVRWAADGVAGDLDPAAAPGRLPAGRAVPPAGDPLGALLLPNGDRLAVRQAGPAMRLVVLPAGPGSVRVLDQWNQSPGSVRLPSVDATGRYALYARRGAEVRIDIHTGRRSPTRLAPLDTLLNMELAYLW